MTRSDEFYSFKSLSSTMKRDIHFSIVPNPRPSNIAIVAPHGGGIEPGTSEVAKALAGSTLSLYCFEGIKARGNQKLHITSTRFDEPQCVDLISKVGIVIAIHACENNGSTIFVGGRHQELKDSIITALRGTGFKAVNDGTRHGGINPYNLCNRGRTRRGVQIELPIGLRRRMFKGLSRKNRTKTTKVFSDLIAALKPVIAEYERA